MAKFLKTKNTQIVNSGGQAVLLQGVNLGGWLMMEGYILHAPNLPEKNFKASFTKTLGHSALEGFEKDFRGAFITKNDIKKIASLNLNCIRVPFNYRLIEKKPYTYDLGGVKYLDEVIAWAKAQNIFIILDLHAAAGAQNCDWHSDSSGKAELWLKKSCQERTFALWEFLADRFKDEEQIAGYDLLNESVTENTLLLNQFYKTLIKRIRAIDKNHILFIEGNKWATDLHCLDHFDDDNYVLSIHDYVPLDFTFNFVPHLSYPGRSNGEFWNKDAFKRKLQACKSISTKRNVPIFVGEFGVNYREGRYGEDGWLKDMLSCFKDAGFHWTYWTYKAVKNSIFPDGLFSYMPNAAWVNRQGPRSGWDTYVSHWPAKRKEIVQSWDTKNFQENTHLVSAIKNAAK